MTISLEKANNDMSRWGRLLLLVAVLFGAILRFAPAALAGTAVNDGGMFYTMIQELRGNGFLIPAVTSYNNLNIPFAYPPLSLYLGAVLSAVGMPTIEVVRWLPAVISTLSIPASYWTASRLLNSPTKGALAAAFYALMPRTFSWYVMGGGLSRSLGIFFLLLTCGAAWSMFSKPSTRHLLLSIVFGAGAVLSHPETALHTAAACLLIGLFRGRNRRGLRDAALTAAGVVMLTSPWWATVLMQHGIGAFASALHTGGSGGPFLVTWLTFGFAQEAFVTVLTVLGLVGLAVQSLRRDWFLPVWTLMPFVVEPRSAPAIAVLPLAMLAAIGLAEFILPKLASLREIVAAPNYDWTYYLECSGAARTVTGIVLLYAFFGAYAFDMSLAGVVVPPRAREAMAWARENTPADARFVVLTGAADPFADATAEWFPALTGRSSVNTLQGREWLLGSSFMPFMNELGSLEGCMSAGPDCVERWGQRHSIGYDYIYIQGSSQQTPLTSVLLAYRLHQDANYKLVYDKDGISVFAK